MYEFTIILLRFCEKFDIIITISVEIGINTLKDKGGMIYERLRYVIGRQSRLDRKG